MARSRDAVDTITGYYYQFDYYILKLLELPSDDDCAYLEGIEDVDISNECGITAVQCKYYSKTEYNHSVIAKPIRFMLKDFCTRIGDSEYINYFLYGKYSAGQDKFPKIMDISFLKEHFLTYVEDKVSHKLYEELALTDEQLEHFLELLKIDICAKSYEEQERDVIEALKKVFRCNDFEAEYYYYNNALRKVKKIATQQNADDRKISKREFVEEINLKDILFDRWFFDFKSEEDYCKRVKKEFFTKNNISPFERFFLVDCDGLISDNDVELLIKKVITNWSKISQRASRQTCPYIYLQGITEERLIHIKKKLSEEGVIIHDGYNFLGADFSAMSMTMEVKVETNLQVKMINSLDCLNEILKIVTINKEIYQFYLEKPFWTSEKYIYRNIPICRTQNVDKMV